MSEITSSSNSDNLDFCFSNSFSIVFRNDFKDVSKPSILPALYGLLPCEENLSAEYDSKLNDFVYDKADLQTQEQPIVEETPHQNLGWARRSDNGYEVSSKGDKRFSAFYAKIKTSKGMRSIEDLYQTEVKGYKTMQEGKGKPALTGISRQEQYLQYKEMWVQFANENPKLMQELAEKTQGKQLTDMFANTDINQARALSEILNEFDYNIEDKKQYSKVNESKAAKVVPVEGSLQHFKKIIGLTKKEIDTSKQAPNNTKTENYNRKFGTAYYVEYKQLGQSNLVTYEIFNKGVSTKVILPIITALDGEFNVDEVSEKLKIEKDCKGKK